MRSDRPPAVEAVRRGAWLSEVGHTKELIEAGLSPSRGRTVLDGANPIDWDDTPTIHQTIELAHGHILHMREVWRADGLITTSPHRPPDSLDSMEAKRRHLEEAMAALESELSLPQHGLSIRCKMGERAIWVSIYKDGQRLRGTQYGISPSVTRIARETRERLQAVIDG